MANIPFLNNAYFTAKVGIGTASPAGILEVAGNTDTDANFLIIKDKDASAGSARPSIRFAKSDGTVLGQLLALDGTNQRLQFSGNNTQDPHLTVYNNGNVGIGTTSPSANLDILNGTTGASLKLSATSTAYWQLQRDPTTGNLNISDDGIGNVMSLDQVSGNVGIGTTSPVSPLTVKSNSVSSGESGIVIQANGNTNSIIKLGERATDGGRFEMLDANVTKIALYTDGTSNYINAGNVGIGTTAPTTKLNVSGSIAVSSGSYLSFIDSNLNYNKIGRNTSVGGIQITTGGNATMNLLDNGNVGIGTTSPSSKLQVSGDAYVTGQFGQGVTVANKIAAYGGEFRSSGASAQIFFGRSGSSVGSGAIGADSTYVFKVWTIPGFGNPFVIKQDGNVGIGTTSPSYKLHVNGGDAQIANGNTATLYMNNSANYLYGDVNGVGIVAAGNNFRVKTNNSERLRIIQNGNVGIGTTNPLDLLHIVSTTADARVIIDSGDGFDAELKFFEDGNVKYTTGFDAATDSYVIGTANVDTNKRLVINSSGDLQLPTYTAGTLVSDASGNISVSSGGGAGGPYLPLSAGSSYPLTGDLYLDDGSGATPSLYFKNGNDNFWRYLMESGGDFSIKEGTSTRLTFQAGGNVGIGTTSPQSGGGAASWVSLNGTAAYSGGVVYTINSTTKAYSYFESDYLKQQAQTGFGQKFIVNGTNTAMTILSAGNVGIGVTSPAQKLHVGDGGIRVEKNATGLGGFISIGNGTEAAGNYSAYFFGNTSNDTGYFKGGIAYETLSTTHGRGDMHFLQRSDTGSLSATISDSVMTILNGGNVGIGTTSPNSKLDIRRSGNGVALELHQTSGSANDFVDLKMIAGNTGAGTLGTILRHKRDGSGGGDFSILTNPTLTGTPTEKLIVKSGGNVGIGNTGPNYKLSVSGGIEAGGVVTYSKVAGSLNTTGYAIAGLGTVFNGASAFFTFTASGGTGQYQRVVYSCAGVGTNWVVYKVIDEGTNVLDIEASATSAATIVFTFKTRSGTQAYSPRVVIQATGHSIISTYA